LAPMKKNLMLGIALALSACGGVDIDKKPPVCTAAQTACGEVCADTTTDGKHCGACGHTCFGGACQAGTCEPLPIAENQSFPYGIAVDGKNVYFTTDDGYVR